MVAAVAGGGVAIGRASVPLVPPPGTAVGALVLNGTGPDGVTMRTTLGPTGSWVRLTASVTGIPRGRALPDRGGGAQRHRRRSPGSWVVAATPGGPIGGSAAVALPDVAAVVVQNEAGHEFVRADGLIIGG